MRPAVVAVPAVAALAGATVLSSIIGPASAADPEPGTGSPTRTISVTDPRGDVLDADDASRNEARKVDVTAATYEVVRDAGIRGGKKKTQTVRFEVEHGGLVRAGRGLGCRARLTVTFTSGDRQYKATTGDSGVQSRTPGGVYEPIPDNYSYGSFCGGSADEASSGLQVPAALFPDGTITDIRATLRVKGSQARDVVEAPDDYLQFTPR